MSRTRPASASTRRCFVMAWRVISVPDVSCAIDNAPPAHRTAMRRRRVSSPSAAKTGADFRSDDFFGDSFFKRALCRGDMFLDVFHLLVPASAVHPKSFQTARRRDTVYPRFDDGYQCAVSDFLQLEFYQRGRFFRIVDRRINRVGMPANGKQSLGLNVYDQHVKD